jgi:hypothetical protein
MNGPFWDAKLETLPPELRHVLREHRLHWQVKRCWDGSPFYRDCLKHAGLEPSTFAGLADWPRLPILHLDDLPITPSDDELAATWAVAPRPWWERVDRIDGGQARAVTDGDAIHQADLAARALWALGARPNQPLALLDGQLEPDDGTGFCDAIVAGASRIGTSITGGGAFAAFAPFFSRPFLPPLAYHCPVGDVLHWNDDHFLIEVVDPATNDSVGGGKWGALVVTDLAREGSPLLRFWTGYRSSVQSAPCSCGRTSTWTRSLVPLT